VVNRKPNKHPQTQPHTPNAPIELKYKQNHNPPTPMSTQNTHLKTLTILLIGIIAGASISSIYFSATQSTPSATLTLNEMYQTAIQDAMIANPNEICNNLTAIIESNTALNWTGPAGNQSVLVVTFTKYASSYPVGQTVNASWGDTWVTVVPEVKTFFQNAEPTTNLTLRTLQLLGLPPNNSNAYFVEMWVNPQALFRPTPDNEITDTTAELSFPASATVDYQAWFNSNIIYSYFPERYPWTRLGYTYDWGSSGGHFGVSEFVVKQGSLVTVESVTPLAEYLQP